MPIGNLTSQLFANVYLNEFDRFVRHVLKPLGYVRYGDDFILFAAHKSAAERMQQLGSAWLWKELHLTVPASSNIVFKARQGIYFLGHRIYQTSTVVDASMVRKVKARVRSANISSYKAQSLPKSLDKQLPWMLIDGH